jgi:hypothetical protein
MDPYFRKRVMDAYFAHLRMSIGAVSVPTAASAAEFVALAKGISTPAFEAENDWRTDPPLPGLLEKPEQIAPNGWRMICASRLYEGAREAGVLFVTLMSGKPVGAFLAEPGTVIPKEYLPAEAR